MRKLICLSVGLLLAGLACLAQAQVPMTGAGKGTPAAAPYAGPGDIAGTTWKWWGGLRGFTAAFSGAVAHICDAATGGTCSNATWAAGTLTLPPIGGNPCNNSTNLCAIDKLYDQTGNGFDLTTLSAPSSPALLISAFGSKPGISCNGSSQTIGFNSATYTQAQPFVATFVSSQASSSTNDILSHEVVDIEITGNSGLLIYAGSSFSRAAALTTTWSFIGTFNGASSQIDTSNTASGAGATTGDAGSGSPASDKIWLCSFNGSSFFWPGKIAEVGEATGSGAGGIFTAGQISALQSQQQSYWGF